MDGRRFDALARSLVVPGSRRRLLGGLAAALGLAGQRGASAISHCRLPGHTCHDDADCCAGVCGPKNPTGRRRCLCRTADEAGQTEIYAQLDAIFQQDIPAIPLMYRPQEFYEFNESQWTGFPTSDNPTAPPMHAGAGIKVYYGLKPKA